jgi:putative protease
MNSAPQPAAPQPAAPRDDASQGPSIPSAPSAELADAQENVGNSRRPPELLAPAGNWDCARAAIENGADAIYFGLDCGFNARHRAANFHIDQLDDLMQLLRQRGVRGYTTMNTLVFPSELPRLVPLIERIATAGADAVLVQDFGVAKLIRTICPELELHASTQMSLTSAETVAMAQQLGLSRAVLARELSVKEITAIATNTTLPLEVFIHGALCVAYSGQCLTSESLGGRSANRGQCAQACRLPYELVCDGNDVDLGDVRYLLSPQDLAGYDAIVALMQAGIASLKIEGRLKTPEYVANLTRHYRSFIDQAIREGHVRVSEQDKVEMELSFSRGFTPGWLEGNDHKRLVPGKHSAKRGVLLGQIEQLGSESILLTPRTGIALGDGIGIESTETGGSEQAMQGGRIYSITDADGNKLKQLDAEQSGWIGFGRGEIDWDTIAATAGVFKNDDPQLNKRLKRTYQVADAVTRINVDFNVSAIAGQPLKITASMGHANALSASIQSEQPLEPARTRPVSVTDLEDKLGRLGATSFALGTVTAEIVGDPMVPASLLNQLRRTLTDQLSAALTQPPPRSVHVAAGEQLLQPIDDTDPEVAAAPQLAALCRTLPQVKAAAKAGVDLIYTDFHDIREYTDVRQAIGEHQTPFGIASIRIQKPGEMGLLRVLKRHQPDFILARNLAAIGFAKENDLSVVADFSLNVANHRAAQWIRSLGVQRVTASYDLNGDQLGDLIQSVPSSWMEIVLHQHIPMFHMEHCVFCSVLSPGTNKTNCGRPCDRHEVHLRDRVGAEHALQADVACRNTLYNATPQSGAESAAGLISAGVRWFRIEFLEDSPEQVGKTVGLYRDLLQGKTSASNVWKSLHALNRVGVTRGTMETKRNPLAVI